MEYQLIVPRIPQDRMLSAVEQVLFNRGILPENVEHYLNTTDADILNPAMITNIDQGARVLVQHIAQGDKVLI